MQSYHPQIISSALSLHTILAGGYCYVYSQRCFYVLVFCLRTSPFTVEMEPPPFTVLVVVCGLHDRWS